MSEYQSYEFQAIDRPLDRKAQEKLCELSSRAKITATTFKNHYQWGDFRGDPRVLVKRWFDLHVYFANWGSRRLMMRLPARSLKRADLEPFLRHVDCVEIETAGDDVIVDISLDEEGADPLREDEAGWLAALAPLRAAVIAGDLRPFYLLWLYAVQYELLPDDEVEPMPGIGPLTSALKSFAEFFGIDSDLVRAAAEIGADESPTSKHGLRKSLSSIPEDEKTDLLLRVLEGDAYVTAELASKVRGKASTGGGSRTALALRTRMLELEEGRKRAASKRREAEQRRLAEEAAKERRVRVDALRKRGEEVWHEIEAQIELRLPQGYDRATLLLSDLQAMSIERGSQDDFSRRMASIRTRHAQKRTFIGRLSKCGLG